jgi:hypothetical protein
MPNFTPTSSEQRKQLFLEILFNKTTRINKVTNNSVLNAIAYGNGKVSGKAEKDIAIALSQLFPDTAFSSQLDQVAANQGVSTRFGASQSSGFVRVVGDPGTNYIPGTHIFTHQDGYQFSVEENVIIGDAGYSYVKLRSVDVGTNLNVLPNTITNVNPTPIGHFYCTNEWNFQYGRNVESDLNYRQRIKDGPNLLARGTISMLEQVFMSINSNILRVKYQGSNSNGQLRIAIITQNGIALNSAELNELLSRGERYFNFSELRPYGKKYYGIDLINIDYQPIDISFRCNINPSANIDEVRIFIQTQIAKYLDPRYFNPSTERVEWDRLLQITQSAPGMDYVPDQYFYPRVDLAVDRNKIPRLRGFAMLNMQGNIIVNLTGTLNPVYYPNQADFSYQSTVLRNI